MSAYVVVDSAVHDPEAFKAYAEKVGAILKAHGGKPIANNAPDSLEGDWAPKRVVILEFPDVEAAKGWYNSPESRRSSRCVRARPKTTSSWSRGCRQKAAINHASC